MANTNYYKTHVEPHVREALEVKYRVPFHSRKLRLTTGGWHEFDAVSEDGSIVASIKSLSGKTAGGKRPAAKYSTCLAEMYYLSLVKADQRILVLTTPAWHEMFLTFIEGRRHPDVRIELVPLSAEIQAEVDKVRDIASGEVTISKPIGEKLRRSVSVKAAQRLV